MKGLVYDERLQAAGTLAGEHVAAYALTWIAVMFVIAWVMYRMRVFVKV